MKLYIVLFTLLCLNSLSAQNYNFSEMVAKANSENQTLNESLNAFEFKGPIIQKIKNGKHSPVLKIKKLDGSNTETWISIQLDNPISVKEDIQNAHLIYANNQVIVIDLDSGETKNYFVINESHPTNMTPGLWSLEVIGVGLEVNQKQ